MAIDPKKLVAAISPNTYCSKKTKKEVKEIVKESLAKKETDPYLKAAEKAELVASEFMDFDEVISTPFKLAGLKNPIEQHTIAYDTSSQAIEQVYYWLHDYIQNNKDDYGDVEKLVDNFLSAPGSAHFSEMTMMKASKMQEEGMKMLGAANQVIKTILQIIYDLKEFRLRLDIWDDYHSKDKNKSEAAYFSLKQIWLDQVDIKKGSSAIKALVLSGTNAPNFVMLIDSFMVVKSLEDIKKVDLNERLQRLLEQRFAEFERWIKESERELRKRYEIERIYLKSQVNNVKLYARWAKPYLKAATQLEQRASNTSSLVNAFNTTLFELTLLGKGDYDPEKDVKRYELPPVFKGKNVRKYAPVILVELKFRSIPERFQQGGYGFRGAAVVTFTSFCLNAEEREALKNQLEWDDFKDVYKIVSGTTDESLLQLQTDIDELLGESDKEEKKKESSNEDTNPFSALFSVFGDLFKKSKPSPKETKEKTLEIKPDSEMEEVMRSQAGIEARRRCRKIYDTFKKANNSPAF